MAEQKPSLFERFGRYYDRLANAWLLVGAAAPAGAMSYLASISDWLAPYGPIAWGLVGLTSFILLVLCISGGLALFGFFRSQSALARFAQNARNADVISPLETTFDRRRINVSSLFHPFFRPIEGATFRNCEFFGPGALLLQGGQMKNCGFHSCDFIIIKNDVHLTSVTVLNGCHIIDCHLWSVPIYLSASQYQHMKAALGSSLNVVTYEPPRSP